MIGHVPRKFLVLCDTFCSTEGHLLAKYLGEDNVAKAWKCRVSTPVDQSRYRAIFFDQKRMRLISSTKDRKKGCAYDPGALMIQGALQNQTLRYIMCLLHCGNNVSTSEIYTEYPGAVTYIYEFL